MIVISPLLMANKQLSEFKKVELYHKKIVIYFINFLNEMSFSPTILYNSIYIHN